MNLREFNNIKRFSTEILKILNLNDNCVEMTVQANLFNIKGYSSKSEQNLYTQIYEIDFVLPSTAAVMQISHKEMSTTYYGSDKNKCTKLFVYNKNKEPVLYSTDMNKREFDVCSFFEVSLEHPMKFSFDQIKELHKEYRKSKLGVSMHIYSISYTGVQKR